MKHGENAEDIRRSKIKAQEMRLQIFVFVIILVACCGQEVIVYNWYYNMPAVASKYGWNVSESACTWEGITCNGAMVISINISDAYGGLILPSFQFQGMYNLTALTMRNLSLQGNLTALLEWLPSLQYLDFSNNKLTGDLSVIPSNVTFVNVSYNQLVGSVSPNGIDTLIVHNNSMDLCNLNITGLRKCDAFPQNEFEYCEPYYYCTICSETCNRLNLTITDTTTYAGNTISNYTTIVSGDVVTFENCTFVDLGTIELTTNSYQHNQVIVSSDCPITFTSRPFTFNHGCKTTNLNIRYDPSLYELWLEGTVTGQCPSKTWLWILVGVICGVAIFVAVMLFVVMNNKRLLYKFIPFAIRRDISTSAN